ncbi:MAG: PEP-CTERM sorting domain-containing protein [Burkholderiales bacterium]|nr:PEP-CTERM sorting domain-containing protein [Burkholderiales bacterium]
MSLRKQLFALSTLAFACAALPAQAKIVDLSFNGTYDLVMGSEIFGVPGPSVAFDYRIKFDTEKNDHFVHVQSGQVIQGQMTAGQDLFGYSASSIVASNIKIGDHVYQPAQLAERNIGGGYTAHIWFDRDISKETPSKVWMMFDASTEHEMNTLQIGGGYLDADEKVRLYDVSGIDYYNYQQGDYKMAFTSETHVAAVPEPETYAMMGFGLLALVALQKRSANKGKH